MLSLTLDKHRAEFMLEQFENALRLITADPTVTVGKLTLMSEREYGVPPVFMSASHISASSVSPRELWVNCGDRSRSACHPVAQCTGYHMCVNRLAHRL
jgi:hypothetical protein